MFGEMSFVCSMSGHAALNRADGIRLDWTDGAAAGEDEESSSAPSHARSGIVENRYRFMTMNPRFERHYLVQTFNALRRSLGFVSVQHCCFICCTLGQGI